MKNWRYGLSVWLSRLRVMSSKEILQLSRDTVLIFFLVYGFTLDIYLAGSGVSLQLTNARMVVHDSDRSAASRELIRRFVPPNFRLEGEIQDAGDGIGLLDQGKAMMVLDIPPGFEESLSSGKQTSVQMQVDTTNSVLGLLATAYSEQIVGEYGLEAAMQRMGLSTDSPRGLPVIIDDHRVWFNPNQNDSWFMAITELLNIITIISILLPAAAMVREKERGTIEQLLVSPLTPIQIMLPKVVAMTAVIMAGTVLSIFDILEPFFRIPIRGSLPLFYGITALYVFTTAGLGLFVSTVARNLAQAGMMTILIMASMIFLSGAWTPPEAMPFALRGFMVVSPLHYYIDASFGIFLKGAGIDLLWPQVLGIAVIGGFMFSFGVWRFRRQFG